MQLCERILNKCGSSSSPAGKSLIPAVLGVVDQQLAGSCSLLLSPTSPCKNTTPAHMAHTASLLLSPSKRALCSSSVGNSPARTAMVMSPPSASKAKRPLAALQCCPNSSSSTFSALSSLSQQHHHHAAAAAGGENEQPGPCPAAKRLEVIQGFPSSASKPRQPITPLITQPEPLAAGIHHSAQRSTPAAHPAASSATAGASNASAPPAALAAVQGAAAAGMSILLDRDNGHLPADQLPSPCAILEAPPALMAASSAAAAGAAVQDHASSTSSILQDAEQLSAPGRHGPQQIAHHIMSGMKLHKQCDVPFNLGYLDGLPDHQPALGSGQLDVIVGPMFAGKTTALLQQLKKVERGRPYLCVKSSKDKRYGDHWIVTHDGRCVPCVPFHSLAEFKAHMGLRWHKIQVIAIDEAQFFPDLVEFCQEAVDHDGKHVIVAGLSGDFRRRRFGQVLDLLPLADSVQQLKSICAVCGGKHGAGLFSLRRVGTGPQEVVGGDEAYLATCRRCYLEHGGQLQ